MFEYNILEMSFNQKESDKNLFNENNHKQKVRVPGVKREKWQ